VRRMRLMMAVGCSCWGFRCRLGQVPDGGPLRLTVPARMVKDRR